MRRTLLLTTIVLAGLAPAAAQAAWTELPPHEQPGGAVATCVRPAGDGAVALLGRLGRVTIATDLLTLGDAGATVSSSSDLGWLAACAEVAVPPGGAAAVPPGASAAAPLLAATVAVRPAGSDVRVAGELRVADAGLPAATLRSARRASIGALSAAAAAGGAAVVAWTERRTVSPHDSWGLRGAFLYAAVRAPGATRFGPARLLDRRGGDFGDAAPSAGIDAGGRATVVWASARTDPLSIQLADIRPGGPVRRQRLTIASSGATALAVAPDGAVLVAAAGWDAVGAFERAPGAARFTRTRLPGDDFTPTELAVALAADGGAVIASRLQSGGVRARMRAHGGGFGPAQLVAGRLPGAFNSTLSFSVETIGGRRPAPPDDARGRQLAAALDGHGTALLTWTRGAYGRVPDRAYAARGTLRAGFSAATALGSPCRSASSARPVVLADGRLAAAWADNSRALSGFLADFATGGGRLHVALPGTTAPATAAVPPRLRARVVGSRALRPGQPLRLRLRCDDGPCDVHATVTVYGVSPGDRSGDDSGFPTGETLPLQAGRTHQLRLRPPLPRRTTLARPGPPARTTVTLAACVPGGPVAARVVLHPLLHGLR